MTEKFKKILSQGVRAFESTDPEIIAELVTIKAEARLANICLNPVHSANPTVNDSCETCGSYNNMHPENSYCFICNTDNWEQLTEYKESCEEVITITLKKNDGFYDFEAPLLALHKKCCEAIEGLIPRGVIIDCHLSDNTPTINTNAGTATISNLCRKNNVVYAVIGIDYELNINDLLLNDLVALYEFLYDFMSELKRDLNN